MVGREGGGCNEMRYDGWEYDDRKKNVKVI